MGFQVTHLAHGIEMIKAKRREKGLRISQLCVGTKSVRENREILSII